MTAINQVVIKRENGDEDMLILCDGCIATIGDYADILRREICAGRCERCESTSTPTAKPTHVVCKTCGSRVSVTKDGLTRVHRKRGQTDQCDGSQRRVHPAHGRQP